MVKRGQDRPAGTAGPDAESPFSEPIVVPIEDSIDLHAFSPKDVAGVLEEYIEQCIRAGISEIRIVHGRGWGVQRRMVRSLLEKHPRVASFKDAGPESGGWGATAAVLRK